MKPRYEHDCDTCIFVGQYEDADLYYHPPTDKDAPFEETVLARWSDDGPDYSSGLVFSYGTHAALTRARELVEEFGIVIQSKV